jgi:hypothetical protein
MISEDELLALVDERLRTHIFSKFKSEDIANDLNERLLELLKYLYLASKYSMLSQNFIPVTQAVDELWHAIILQTRYYERLCAKLPGKRIIHHESIPFEHYREKKSRKEIAEEILRWLMLYVKNFGDMKDDRLKYWFFINNAADIVGISLKELNTLAKADTYFSVGTVSCLRHEEVPEDPTSSATPTYAQ